MNKLYTLLIVFFLAGCSPQGNSFYSAQLAFKHGCDTDSIDTNLTSSGNKMTLTATCTKAK